jgi:nuclear transport factor 2 (NTF2) superfamily protein
MRTLDFGKRRTDYIKGDDAHPYPQCLKDLSHDSPASAAFRPGSATIKVQAAENGWNGRNPSAVAQAYSADSQWRNRAEFLMGRTEIETFLTRKWEREQDYRLIKELWAWH